MLRNTNVFHSGKSYCQPKGVRGLLVRRKFAHLSDSLFSSFFINSDRNENLLDVKLFFKYLNVLIHLSLLFIPQTLLDIKDY